MKRKMIKYLIKIYNDGQKYGTCQQNYNCNLTFKYIKYWIMIEYY